jgi:hydrogenase maturation factor
MTLDADRCITCGDIAVTATVVHVDGSLAVVDAGGALEQVATELVEPVVVGDLLLCHAGIALEKVPLSS